VVLAAEHLVPLPPPVGTSQQQAGWEQRWTSCHQLSLESDVLSVLDAPADRPGIDPSAVAETVARFPTLGADQDEAVTRLASSGRPAEVLVGRAGTGKTFTLAALRSVLSTAGSRVVGVAPSARAARELADTAGIDAYTFPRFRLHVASGLCRSDVVVVDEAAMAATSDLHHVLTAAHRAGARVILVGDHHQLPEINAGGVFAAAVARRHGDVAELTINRRQHARWEHDALDHLRHGRPLEGLRAYIDHGHVHLAGSPAEVHTCAVEDWLEAHRAGVDAILLAGTVAEARRLNHLARHAVADELTGPVFTCRGRKFQVGDRVVLLRNQGETFGHLDVETGRACRVDNGMVGTIHGIDAQARITVTLKGGRRTGIDSPPDR
jgi:ATP-dependent exoDNAse (exonuclease V) alpha subunit